MDEFICIKPNPTMLWLSRVNEPVLLMPSALDSRLNRPFRISIGMHTVFESTAQFGGKKGVSYN